MLDGQSYAAKCRWYCRGPPTVPRDTASHKYSPAVMLHKAGSHDCRPYAWASAVPFNDQALKSADQLPIQLPLQ
jgi:hypothetical protein